MTPPEATLRARLAVRLRRSWARRDWLAIALLDISLLYRGLMALRRWLYARGIFATRRVAAPVIVVGNVVAGGAGKTPVVIEIVRHLKAQGWQPGVVSRGYGRKVPSGRSYPIEVHANTVLSESGDEPALIKQATGAHVFVAKRRIDAARSLLQDRPGVNVIVCDDGLQHLALHRDIEVCVWDEHGVGNGWLLPAGPLREPWPRQPMPDFVLQTVPADAARTDAVLTEAPPLAAQVYPVHRRLAIYALRSDGSQVLLSDLVDKTLCAVAAIAHPEAFFAMLRAEGLTLAETISLPDHYNFDSWPRNDLQGQTLICTQKDAIKLWKTHPQALAVPLKVSIAPEFFAALCEKLSSLPEHN
jgi:tetraacyldisaccharide 4'-kinase